MQMAARRMRIVRAWSGGFKRENLLICYQKKHKISLTIIESGLSQLIEDDDTPVTMVGALKALKQYTKSTAEDKDLQPTGQKFREKIPKVEKQEYFEDYVWYNVKGTHEALMWSVK